METFRSRFHARLTTLPHHELLQLARTSWDASSSSTHDALAELVSVMFDSNDDLRKQANRVLDERAVPPWISETLLMPPIVGRIMAFTDVHDRSPAGVCSLWHHEWMHAMAYVLRCTQEIRPWESSMVNPIHEMQYHFTVAPSNRDNMVVWTERDLITVESWRLRRDHSVCNVWEQLCEEFDDFGNLEEEEDTIWLNALQEGQVHVHSAAIGPKMYVYASLSTMSGDTLQTRLGTFMQEPYWYFHPPFDQCAGMGPVAAHVEDGSPIFKHLQVAPNGETLFVIASFQCQPEESQIISFDTRVSLAEVAAVEPGEVRSMKMKHRFSREPSVHLATLAVTETALFVCDAYITTLRVYSLSGTPVRQIQLDPTASLSLRPPDIWIWHADGRLYLVPESGTRVLVLGEDGSIEQDHSTIGMVGRKVGRHHDLDPETDRTTLTNRHLVRAVGYQNGRLLLHVHKQLDPPVVPHEPLGEVDDDAETFTLVLANIEGMLGVREDEGDESSDES
jgi:hypothetical protein